MERINRNNQGDSIMEVNQVKTAIDHYEGEEYFGVYLEKTHETGQSGYCLIFLLS